MGDVALSDLDLRVRSLVYNRFMSTGRAPVVAEIGSDLGASLGDVQGALAKLAGLRQLVLQSNGQVLMANPFSACPRPSLCRRASAPTLGIASGTRWGYPLCSGRMPSSLLPVLTAATPCSLRSTVGDSPRRRESCTSRYLPASGGRTSSTRDGPCAHPVGRSRS
jgi:hypothetical protein